MICFKFFAAVPLPENRHQKFCSDSPPGEPLPTSYQRFPLRDTTYYKCERLQVCKYFTHILCQRAVSTFRTLRIFIFGPYVCEQVKKRLDFPWTDHDFISNIM